MIEGRLLLSEFIPKGHFFILKDLNKINSTHPSSTQTPKAIVKTMSSCVLSCLVGNSKKNSKNTKETLSSQMIPCRNRFNLNFDSLGPPVRNGNELCEVVFLSLDSFYSAVLFSFHRRESVCSLICCPVSSSRSLPQSYTHSVNPVCQSSQHEMLLFP